MSDMVQLSLESIGATLRDARVEAYLTQSEVGQRAGVSRQLVSRIEQGCNGEISAYASVAAALNYRLAVMPESAEADAVTATATAGLDFTVSPSLAFDDPQ
jgi:transcriptional regulator with XRE-family HTH domain